MKAILISIKPKYVAEILNGTKTLEIRKTMPKCDLPIDVYIYCTKSDIKGARENFTFEQLKLLGKVVAKFTLNKVEEYINGHKWENLKECLGSCLDYEKVLEPSCLTDDELYAYANDLHFYAWHISNLEIFDKPKELSEFNSFQRAKATDCGLLKQCKKCGRIFNRCHLLKPLTKAPQSMCYVEVE